MKTVVKKRNRKSVKAEKLAKAIKAEIVDGRYKSGDLLPTREQLVEDYNTSKLTLQKSIVQLMNEGFIVTQGTNGTYVAENLPCDYQIGIVIPEHFKNIMLYSSIMEAIKVIEAETPYNFKIYHMFDYKEQLDIKQLKKDVKGNLLKGIILLYIDSKELDALKICDNNELPILSLVNDDTFKVKGNNINYISFNYKALIDQTIKNLKDTNLKQVAWIANELFSTDDHEYLKKQCEEKDICTKPQWIHGIALDEYSHQWIPNIIRLLTDSAKLDAVVVLNENLLDGVLTGLNECEISIENDIKVISHFSFPYCFDNAVTVSKMGFDIQAFLIRGIEIIQDMKSNMEYKEYIVDDIKIEDGK